MLLIIMIVLLPLLWWRIEQGSGVRRVGTVQHRWSWRRLGALLLLRRQAMPSWLPRAAALLPEIAARLRQALFNPILRAQVVGYGLLVQLLSVAALFCPWSSARLSVVVPRLHVARAPCVAAVGFAGVSVRMGRARGCAGGGVRPYWRAACGHRCHIHSLWAHVAGDRDRICSAVAAAPSSHSGELQRLARWTFFA